MKKEEILKSEVGGLPPSQPLSSPHPASPTGRREGGREAQPQTPPLPSANVEGESVPLRGRTAFLERYRTGNPDITDDPDDDTLYDWAGSGLTERDEIRGKYDALNGANEKLAAVVSQDPRFAQFISLIASGENIMYALGKTFGNLIDELDEEGLENLRSGQEEFKNRFNKVRDNFNTYESTLKAYAEENKLDENILADINDTILDLAEAFNDRAIPREIIEIVHKGLDYDNEKTAEIEAAKLAGKNEAIDAIKDKKAPVTSLPDLGASKTQPRAVPSPRLSADEAYKPYVDGLQVVK